MASLFHLLIFTIETCIEKWVLKKPYYPWKVGYIFYFITCETTQLLILTNQSIKNAQALFIGCNVFLICRFCSFEGANENVWHVLVSFLLVLINFI